MKSDFLVCNKWSCYLLSDITIFYLLLLITELAILTNGHLTRREMQCKSLLNELENTCYVAFTICDPTGKKCSIAALY